MVGYVIETYPDGNFEVEISNSEGVTVAQIVASESDLALATEETIATTTSSE